MHKLSLDDPDNDPDEDDFDDEDEFDEDGDEDDADEDDGDEPETWQVAGADLRLTSALELPRLAAICSSSKAAPFASEAVGYANRNNRTTPHR